MEEEGDKDDDEEEEAKDEEEAPAAEETAGPKRYDRMMRPVASPSMMQASVEWKARAVTSRSCEKLTRSRKPSKKR